MSVTLTWTGLDELRQALRDLPAGLTDDARTIVLGHGDRAAADIVAGYPDVSGNLQKGVSVRTLPGTGPFYAGVEVRSRAPHAALYEWGSAVRSYDGKNRGQMPPAPTGKGAIPKIMRERRAMYGDLRGVLERAGLIASGGDA
jgi:hypothetical protein